MEIPAWYKWPCVPCDMKGAYKIPGKNATSVSKREKIFCAGAGELKNLKKNGRPQLGLK